MGILRQQASMRLLQVCWLVASVASSPRSSLPRIDVQRFVSKALREQYPQDKRVKVPVGMKAPSAYAAVEYVRSAIKEGLCAQAAEAYVESVMTGATRKEATAAATRAFITAFNNGTRYEAGGACAAAAKAWKEARRKGGREHVLDATEAFISAWPGVKAGNPCALAGTSYVKSILAGKSHLEANSVAMREFLAAVKQLAARGEALTDVACHKAARAFYDAVPEKPDPVIGAAFTAFSDKIFSQNGVVFDPVCLAAMETFIDSHAAGDDLLTANLKAAQSFFKAFVSGSDIPADSPCATATLAYANTMTETPSTASTAGMIAYITEALKQGERKVDPVCGAATLAYWDAYIAKKSESAASEAAAIAYLDTLEQYPDFDTNSACGQAADAYISEFSR